METATKLYEAAKKKGISLPDSREYWNEDLSTKFPVAMGRMADWMTKPYIQAYTTDELFEWLPGGMYQLTPRATGAYKVYCTSWRMKGISFEADSPAEVLALLALHLIEIDYWQY